MRSAGESSRFAGVAQKGCSQCNAGPNYWPVCTATHCGAPFDAEVAALDAVAPSDRLAPVSGGASLPSSGSIDPAQGEVCATAGGAPSSWQADLDDDPSFTDDQVATVIAGRAELSLADVRRVLDQLGSWDIPGLPNYGEEHWPRAKSPHAFLDRASQA